MAKGTRGGKRAGGVSQKKLSSLFQEQAVATWGANPDARNNATMDWELNLANRFSKAKANKNNFFENSVGEWDLKKSAPRRDPDHVSINRRTGKISSQYWYTKDGVYRKSNHWGTDVASCSWGIKGRKYKNEGVDVGRTETAFIKWKDLKAKGMVALKSPGSSEYRLIGFDFKK